MLWLWGRGLSWFLWLIWLGRGFGIPTSTGVLSDIDELLTIWNRAFQIGRAGARGIHGGRTPEGDGAWAPGLNSAHKCLGLSPSELALEQSRQLRILGGLLAVGDAFRRWLITVLRKKIVGEWR